MGEQYWEPVQTNRTVDDPETLLEPARGIYAKEMLCACMLACVCVRAHVCMYVRERQGVEEGVGREMLQTAQIHYCANYCVGSPATGCELWVFENKESHTLK